MSDWFEVKEPLLCCLQQSLAGWQAAVDRILAQSGISAMEWRLLRYLHAHRGAAASVEPPDPPVLENGRYEEAVCSLVERGWLEARPARDGLPILRAGAVRRLERLAQAIKALQSVWLAPLSLEERGMMICCLSRMQRQLASATPRTGESDYSTVEQGLPPVASSRRRLG
ncbi:hypothetical protein [Cupriavidus sp. AU9028]|uniref:hypothetical protein n=1 Tax=Cupriavidus sp. AU9028 TaxID=2871157 RepID=UPI001C975B36|nr:hypothetical protein [Cupriavidus sp. AU9028]MBY4896938.1 hypothetical protein [Cupriavidus sp. AU9028]